MASSISAGTTSSTALVATADTSGALQLATNNGTVAVTVDTSQNVGVGTVSPSYKLDVTGQGRATTGFAVSTDGSTFTPSGLNAIPNYGVGYITSTSTSTLSGFGGLTFYTNQVAQARIDSSGVLSFNSGYGSAATAYGCRVWVNFNGTTSSPSTIRGSGNVSSVTKNGTGDFTINFTTALVDTNYAPMITADRGGHAAMGYKPTTIATSSYRFTSVQQQGTALDSEFTSVTIFR